MPRLTLQEQTVLKLAAKGLTNPEIGQLLGLRPSTVAGHLHGAYGKLGVDNRWRAVVVALRRRLLTVEDLTDPVEEEGGGRPPLPGLAPPSPPPAR